MSAVQQGAPPFNPDDLNSVGLWEKLTQPLIDNPQWWLGLCRRFWPVPKFRNCALLTRYDDVRDALARQQVFAVSFGPKMEELNGGPNFLLGMQDGPDYRRQRSWAMRVFRLDDIATRIRPLSAELADAAVASSSGRLDAIEDLITRIPTELCERYYGIPIAEKKAFALWAIAMSAYTFDPSNNEAWGRAARAAARNMWPVVDAAIAKARAGKIEPDTILGRLAALAGEPDGGPSDKEIRSILMGMVTGFVPTNTMAAGHMLEMLLRRPDFLARAQDAALANDDDLLSRCLFEAMRFMPLNMGPFRVCSQDYVVAEGTPRATRIRRNTTVLVSTQSAMFDRNAVKAPRRFDPDRPAHDYMLFGAGLHWCVGARVADVQITQMFKALLIKRNLRRVAGRDGRLTRIGPFPAHLFVQFDP
jgi:cytochrome P450